MCLCFFVSGDVEEGGERREKNEVERTKRKEGTKRKHYANF